MSATSVWTFLRDCGEKGLPAVLLVIVEGTAETPGKPGFKMAVAADGRLCGTIGGGAMEHDLVEDARAMLTGESTGPVIVRRVHSQDAPADRSGMICGGNQQIALYPCGERDGAAIAQVADVTNRGARGLVRLTEARIAYEDGAQNETQTVFRADEETGWVYEENVGLADTVYLAGGGHVGLALSRVLSTLGFRIVVFDDRPDVSTMRDNTYAHAKRVGPFECLKEHIPEGDHSYVVIMTPSHRHDECVLRQFVGRPLRYLGLMGSKRKLAEIFLNLRRDGIPEDALDRIHAPIGLPIGSRTAEEIAISIAAQIVAVRNAGPGKCGRA